MKTRSKEKKLLILGAFAAILLLLCVLLALGLSRGDAVRFGVYKGADAFGACALMQTRDASYQSTLASTAGALREALVSARVDAALLPAALALGLPESEYSVQAVLSYETLVAVSFDAGVKGVADLSARAVALPAASESTPAQRMLTTLLREAGVSASVSFAPDDLPALENDQAVAFVRLDDLPAYLRLNPGAQARFSLSAQWRSLLDSQPPAGACLVVRSDYLARAGGDYAAFLKKLADSVAYADEKRKKAVAMIVSAGLSGSEGDADSIVGYLPFICLTGAQMDASLASYRAMQ